MVCSKSDRFFAMERISSYRQLVGFRDSLKGSYVLW